MSARTKQTVRFCTRHRGRSPIAFSLEPCEDVHMIILSQLDRETQEGRTNICSCDHVLVKARVSTSHLLILSQQMSVDSQTRHQTLCAFLLDVVIRQIVNGCLNRRGALGPIAGQQIGHVELGPGSNSTASKHCYRMIQNSCLTIGCGNTKDETQKQKICMHWLRPAKTPGTVGRKQNHPAVLAEHTDRRTCLVSSQHMPAPQNGCETTQGRERIRQFVFAAALRTEHKNFLTLLDDVPSKLTGYLIGHFKTLYLTVCGSVHNDN